MLLALWRLVMVATSVVLGVTAAFLFCGYLVTFFQFSREAQPTTKVDLGRGTEVAMAQLRLLAATEGILLPPTDEPDELALGRIERFALIEGGSTPAMGLSLATVEAFAMKEEGVVPDPNVTAVTTMGIESTNNTDFKWILDAYMVVGEQYDVSLAMQNSTWAQSELSRVSKALKGPIALSDSLQLTNEVRVQLVGSGFDITETKGGWQSVVPQAASIWSWTVVPRSVGPRTLLISIENEASWNGTTRVVPVRSYFKDVLVQERSWQWLTDASIWGYTYAGQAIMLICTLVSGAVGYTQLQTFFEERRSSKAKRSPSPKKRRVA